MEHTSITVEVDAHAGFCYGVARAVNMTEDELEKRKAGGEPLYCLGDLVHNEAALERLQKEGLLTIEREDFEQMKGGSVVFRAHGEPPESYHSARVNGIHIVDASCPIVKKIQQRIGESYGRGEFIMIFGDPKHPEVIAFNAHTGNKAHIVDQPDKLDPDELPLEITLYSQTTRLEQDFYRLVHFLKRSGKKVEVNNTICRHVSNRFPQLESFCKKYDKIIFVGGRDSSNARSLHEACCKINPETRFVGGPEQVQRQWFSPGDRVGVTGATSTPPWLLQLVAEKITSINNP